MGGIRGEAAAEAAVAKAVAEVVAAVVWFIGRRQDYPFLLS